MIVVIADEGFSLNKDADEQDAEDKATHVRPPGNAADVARIGNQAEGTVKELEEKPPAEE